MRLDAESEKGLKSKGFEYVEGLDPIVWVDSEILVLGSCPSGESIRKREYYATASNRFWPLVAEIFGCAVPERYEDKLDMLKEHHVALWDVYRNGYRKGSRDGYESAELNDIKGFLVSHPSIRRIAIAGKDAQAAFAGKFGDIGVPVIPVTSTSAANGHFDALKSSWHVAFGICRS